MLPKIKTILYASDLGNHTRPAIRTAAAIAVSHQAKIIYLHVLEPITNTARSLVSSYISEKEINERLQQNKDEMTEYMQKRIAKFHEEELSEEENQLETRVMVKIGRIEEEILKVAEEQGADMIVMGSRTHSGVGQFMMGSSANKIVHTSSIPVLVVPIRD
ncbi:universal stress protein [Gynuella sunshinyii]|uniref:Universal stress protein n=1 Tax=Gynuella sunshinyii YC6258 TaxID=1445510 RepID=A0A0C5V6U6_9GAMM|nr:universal stress protein [Gynuella sunshinyii]AJQ95150.1 universal stress protein UspA and related nucleotide-binding protein [Gynuella sunshinyii YC6258]